MVMYVFRLAREKCLEEEIAIYIYIYPFRKFGQILDVYMCGVVFLSFMSSLV